QDRAVASPASTARRPHARHHLPAPAHHAPGPRCRARDRAPNDAIVRVTRTCICGSDIHIYNVDDMAVHLKKMTDWLGADVCIDAVGCDASGSLLHSLTGKVMMLQGGSAIALHWAINS